MDDEQIAQELARLSESIATLEGKMDELYMRPRMPYSQGAYSGDILELDSNLKPQWVTP
jgi:hypothetical protein